MTDALLSLSCLLILVTILLPFIIKLKTEQHHLNLQQEAYYVMQDLKNTASTSAGLNEESDLLDDHFNITTTPYKNHQLICVEWVKENEEIENYCQYTPL
ncbi:hypothetical protein FHR85_002842 [Alkalibacillus almallahensis]|nr:hypothetical protein [Alkalibacillus almallahensis]